MTEDPILGDLLSDTRRVVRELLDQPLADPAIVRAELAAAADAIRDHGVDDDAPGPADLGLGRSIARRCAELLDRWDQCAPRDQKRIQAAVRYFADRDDANDDQRSAFGFDDDLEVINAVSRAIGLSPVELG
ncbi:MAG: hypothetical protein ABMB14_34245 [Myxococcota bacterium]